MTKYFISFIFLFGLISSDLFGQITPIQLDRPDQTECPFIVPAGFIQFESGINFENVNAGVQNFAHPTVLWKYGLHEKFEFRLITELGTEKTGLNKVTGLYPVTVGFKTNICQEKGIIPVISFIGHLTTANLGSKDFHTSYLAPSFRFTMQHTLTDRVSLAYNLGAEWNGETARETYIYTLTTGISITNKLGSYLELYGFAAKDSQTDHRFDCGFTYLINNDCMMDLSGGFGLTRDSPNNYVSLGFSYRFKAIKNK